MTLEEALEKLNSGDCPSGLILNLRKNSIGDKGAQVLANALESGNSPTGLNLDLSMNNISDEGAQALAKVLKSGNCPSGLRLIIEIKSCLIKKVQIPICVLYTFVVLWIGIKIYKMGFIS